MCSENNKEVLLVTVIMVTYNSSAYVREAIDSVLLQSYSNIELIIGDDVSTDDTWEIIQEFKDQRIRAYKNPINLGEYPNRNKAISLSKGEFIYFIDGDDLMLFRGIEDTLKDLVRFPKCELAVVRPENPKFIGPIEIDRLDALNLEFFGGGVLDSSLANNIFRTAFLKKNLFLVEYKNSDQYSRILFLKSSNLLVLVTPIAIWRITKNQASKKITIARQARELLTFYQDYLFASPEYSELNQNRLKRRYYRTLFSLIFSSFRNGDFHFYKLRNFLIDDWRFAFEIALHNKSEDVFWSHYNYYNINIYFKNKNK